MRVLVLGATGFLGTPLIPALQARGHEPIATARDVSALGGDVESHAVDRGDAGEVAALVAACRASVVVDVIAYLEANTLPLFSALAGRIDRYLLLSSADVYRNYALFQRSEQGTPEAVLTEGSELRRTCYPYRGAAPRAADAGDAWMDDYDKIPLEAALRGSSLGWTIARLPMVYGPGDRQRRFRAPITHMRTRGEEPYVLPAAWANWVSSHGYVDDVADALALLATDARAEGRIVNVAERAPRSQLAWAEAFAEALDWRGSVRSDANAPLPPPLTDLNLEAHLVLSTQVLHEELGFRAPTPPDVALARTIAAEAER